MSKRETEYISDLDGTAIALVPVGKQDAICTIAKADHDFLIKSGVSPNWAVSNSKYVTAIRDGKRDYIARMVCMCRTGQFISYKDGDPLNLRRANLQVMEKRHVPVTFHKIGEAA